MSQSLVDTISKEFIFKFLSLSYAEFFKHGIEVAFYYGSTVVCQETYLLKLPVSRYSCSERLDDALVLLGRFRVRCF